MLQVSWQIILVERVLHEATNILFQAMMLKKKYQRLYWWLHCFDCLHEFGSTIYSATSVPTMQHLIARRFDLFMHWKLSEHQSSLSALGAASRLKYAHTSKPTCVPLKSHKFGSKKEEAEIDWSILELDISHTKKNDYATLVRVDAREGYVDSTNFGHT